MVSLKFNKLKVKCVSLSDWARAEGPENWQDNLDNYLADIEIGKFRPTTIKTYTSWLQRWVDWLVEQKDGIELDSMLIKKYLNERF